MVTELQASGEQELTALVYYAALEATELRDAVEETTHKTGPPGTGGK